MMEIYRPSDALLPYVRYYWVFRSDTPLTVLTFPIGCPQIIFHKRTPLFIPELGSSQSRVTISGQVNFPAHIHTDGNLEMVVAVFRPHTIGMFIDTPPSSFYNLEISGDNIGNKRFSEFASRILECRDNAESVRILDSLLTRRIRPSLNIDRIGDTVDRLMRKPSVSVRDLADGACLSKKQFERVFREAVGMNPKEYSRVVRFQKAMRLMQCGSHDFAAIAAECGFADQSHFIREFKTMSGLTPGALLATGRPYSDLFTNPA